MKSVLLAVFVVISALFVSIESVAEEEAFKGFVALSAQKELFVDYVPAQGKQPTVVLINGLTYSTRQWNGFTEALLAKGVGVLRYDPIGQGQTLLKYAPVMAPIPYQDQIVDLKSLLEKMNIKGPYNLVGLSYGGGIAAGFAAAYPTLVKNLVLMAPFTRPLDGTDNWIKAQIWATRQIFPFNKMSDDDLYDYYLHQIVYATYPQAEPIVLENPFKLEATYRLVQGIRKARPIDLTHLIPARSLHLMIARQDQYISTSVLDEYWDAVPEEARASRLYVNGSEHKMVEAVPNFTAAWVYEIVKGNKRLYKGDDFEGYPYRGEVRSGQENIKVGRE
ncbi:MAG: lysophospholipase [Bdellovibrio sp. ArHS]|uniref:alpha/beta hydrolase n=1 Tax=Bdellovibrio sp. ArHS TaxID=1569284 RepID=UPI0005831958|nr:alpha/beta hydrolase [Bdellovibrio sp. ArHS]KHD87393.1 MAG: lysophospholipase [Bdellovibrio sp. ArHS]